jgi:hypothetical protein
MLQPQKKPRGGALSYADKVRNRLLSSIRVRVEHAAIGPRRHIYEETYRIMRKEKQEP